jgi:hypothetical protein
VHFLKSPQPKFLNDHFIKFNQESKTSQKTTLKTALRYSKSIYLFSNKTKSDRTDAACTQETQTINLTVSFPISDIFSRLEEDSRKNAVLRDRKK